MLVQQRLRIAQIAPLAERVPPLKYGGTERVVAALTDELVRRGHDVTLFATGDSETLATLVPLVPSGLRLLPGLEMPRDIHPPQMLQLGRVFEHARVTLDNPASRTVLEHKGFVAVGALTLNGKPAISYRCTLR
jgi:hypothetical protein